MHGDQDWTLIRLDMKEEWLCGAYDERGEAVFCACCGGELKWQPKKDIWQCASCGAALDRADYFETIGAEPPRGACLTDCKENYPLCRQFCKRML